MTRVLAISSGGGHWDEMIIITESLGEFEIVFASTFDGLADAYGIAKCELVTDCNRDTFISIFKCALDIWRLIKRNKPDIILSTGAAPGLIAVAIGRLFSCRTIWVDSLANSTKMSLSGWIAQKICHLCLTQWSHLERRNGPNYWGNIL